MRQNHLPFFLNAILICSAVVHCRASEVLIKDGGNDTIILIKDGGNDTIISPGNMFELGFFSPDNKNRYLGIWYYQSKPKIVVWVANREKPLSESNGSLVLKGGKVKLLDSESRIYWSTNSGPNNCTLELRDNGNLILKWREELIWQSFDEPTDTFLPGMNSGGFNYLTSWLTRDNPAPGSFRLFLQQTTLQISRGSSSYWEYEANTPFDELPAALSDLLLGKNNGSGADKKNTRLVMDFTGQIQFWEWEGHKNWNLLWWEPRDGCSFDNPCGDFGSCDSRYNGLGCQCLPGFKPIAPDTWKSGHFSGGCMARSQSCERNFTDDLFLKLPMMKVGTPNHNASNEIHKCETNCRKDCHCVAYSCGTTNCTSNAPCYMWKSTDLTNLQDHYSEGYTIFIRTTFSDIANTSRNCNPCGVYTVPYPLSTSKNCGDPSYSDFHCNATTGQVFFSTSGGTFRVASIDPDSKTFIIQISNISSCDSKYVETHLLSTKLSSQYNFRKCIPPTVQSFLAVEKTFFEVEMGWEPPPEPACKTPSDCRDWTDTACKTAKGGAMRCLCVPKFRWDGSNLKCTREKAAFPLKSVLAAVAGLLGLVILCGILFIHNVRQRISAKKQRTDDILRNDTESIDVPYFNFESVLAATNNFADENKLGAGGFGAVYKGVLPGGGEIAVKRLSRVTEQGVAEFRTEVVLIAKLQHRNLVKLLGYSVKADEKILIYEFMPNGNLDSCLFDETRSLFLDWKMRFDIIIGVARGLLYLHQDSRLRIIHRDLKPSNILLDEELNAKISDFGLAKIIGGKDTEGSTKRVVGTYGYMAPEYAYEGLFSVKSDVFSFGVVVLETISGRRNSKLFVIQHGTTLQGQAWKLWNEEKGMDMMDQTLKESCNPSEVLNCFHVGLLCVQKEPEDRPTMSEVVMMLSTENASLPQPKQPAFSTVKQPSETPSSSSVLDPSFSNTSFNDVITVSTEGR